MRNRGWGEGEREVGRFEETERGKGEDEREERQTEEDKDRIEREGRDGETG